jgi:glycosyltransferase involved in cell wall biosynthesis
VEADMKDKISIIIPVYNVEPYIRKCLDSVVSQTYENLEIICIDDGSTDSSGKICDGYAEKDSRVKVFHQKNCGLSYALNVGLKNFTGDYLGFVDSDDWIEPEMYGELHKALKNSGANISIASYFKETDEESIPMANRERISEKVIDTKNMLLYPLKRDYYIGFCGYVWNKLYLASIANGLSFDNDIKYCMDVLFYMTMVLKNKCMGVYIDKPLYHYYQRNSAISKSKSLNIKADSLTVYKRVE